MEELKKVVKTTEVVEESYVISGRVLNLLKEYIKSQVISKRKFDIIKLLIGYIERTSIDTISDELKMSKPLLAYHFNGNLKSNGLIKLEMVISEEIRGRIYYTITDYGRYVFELAQIKDSPSDINTRLG